MLNEIQIGLNTDGVRYGNVGRRLGNGGNGEMDIPWTSADVADAQLSDVLKLYPNAIVKHSSSYINVCSSGYKQVAFWNKCAPDPKGGPGTVRGKICYGKLDAIRVCVPTGTLPVQFCAKENINILASEWSPTRCNIVVAPPDPKADCEASGGTWDATTNVCKQKKAIKQAGITQYLGWFLLVGSVVAIGYMVYKRTRKEKA